MTFNLENYREKPKQCNKCFSYMHTSSDCKGNPRCSKCSDLKSNHPENLCNRIPFCFLCKGDHPPTSRKCHVYAYEEDLLNEALKRGCGRGHIRAERRRTTNIQNSTNRTETSQTIPLDTEKVKNTLPQSQPLDWTEQRSRTKGRNRERNKSIKPQVSNTITFELPEMYSKKSMNKQPKNFHQKDYSEKETNTTSCPQKDPEANKDSDPKIIPPVENEERNPISTGPADTMITPLPSCSWPSMESPLDEEIRDQMCDETQEIQLDREPQRGSPTPSPSQIIPATFIKTLDKDPSQEPTTSKSIKKPLASTRNKTIQTRPLSNSPPMTNLQEPP